MKKITLLPPATYTLFYPAGMPERQNDKDLHYVGTGVQRKNRSICQYKK